MLWIQNNFSALSAPDTPSFTAFSHLFLLFFPMSGALQSCPFLLTDDSHPRSYLSVWKTPLALPQCHNATSAPQPRTELWPQHWQLLSLFPCIMHIELIHHQCHPSPCQTTLSSSHGARHLEQTPVDGFPRRNVQSAQGAVSKLFPVLCKWDLTPTLSAFFNLPAPFHSALLEIRKVGWFQGSKAWIWTPALLRHGGARLLMRAWRSSLVNPSVMEVPLEQEQRVTARGLHRSGCS